MPPQRPACHIKRHETLAHNRQCFAEGRQLWVILQLSFSASFSVYAVVSALAGLFVRGGGECCFPFCVSVPVCLSVSVYDCLSLSLCLCLCLFLSLSLSLFRFLYFLLLIMLRSQRNARPPRNRNFPDGESNQGALKVLTYIIITHCVLRFTHCLLRCTHYVLRFSHSVLRFTHCILRFTHCALRFTHCIVR